MLTTIVGSCALLLESFVRLDGQPFYGDHPSMFATFALLLLAAELKPMSSLTDDTELTASWAFAFTLLLVAPSAGALLAVALAPLATDIHQRSGRCP